MRFIKWAVVGLFSVALAVAVIRSFNTADSVQYNVSGMGVAVSLHRGALIVERLAADDYVLSASGRWCYTSLLLTEVDQLVSDQRGMGVNGLGVVLNVHRSGIYTHQILRLPLWLLAVLVVLAITWHRSRRAGADEDVLDPYSGLIPLNPSALSTIIAAPRSSLSLPR